MKSKMTEDRYIIECDCGSPDHLVIFDFYNDVNFRDVYLTICSKYRKSFIERFIIIIKYLFGIEKYLATDGIMFSEDNISELEEVIKIIKENKDV